MTQIKKLKSSTLELKNVYSLAGIAMLLALRIVLGIFANGTLPFFGNNVKISGAFLPIAITGAMYGCVPAALVGALGDILSFIINPVGAAYFPGFTISGLLTGFIYGMAFYKNNVTAKRVIIAWLINTFTVETFLAAFWLFYLYGAKSGDSYHVYLITRFISQAVKCIPEILLILGVGKLSAKVHMPQNLRKHSA